MKKISFTKLMVITYSISFIIWVTWSYILATIGKEQIAEELSSSIVTVGIALILGYYFKAYFETHSEEYNKLQKEKWKHELKMAQLGQEVDDEQ